MKLRTETQLAILAALLGLMLVLVVIQRWIVLGSFARLEREQTTKDVERARDALDQGIDYLDSKSADWANWDDTYAYMQDRNPVYVESNLLTQAFQDLSINLMAFVTPDGEALRRMLVDIGSGKEAPIPPALAALLRKGSPLLVKGEGEPVKGLARIDGRVMMLVGRPVLTSEGTGPSRGILVFGRWIDEAERERIAGVTHLEVALEPIAAEGAHDDLADLDTTGPASPIVIRVLGSDRISGHTVLADLGGEPALHLSIVEPRKLWHEGERTVWYLVAALGVAGVAIMTILFVFQERRILSRLSRLGHGIERTGRTGDLSARVPVTGDDEIAGLERNVNSMLADLEKTKEALGFEREQVEAKDRLLVQSQKMQAVGRLAGGVAHDFNNILGVIIGTATMAETDAAAGADVKEHIAAIRPSADRAAKLTKQLLVFSRQHAFRTEVMDPARSVRQLEDMLRRMIGEDVALEISLPEETWMIRADPAQFDQVIMNLTVNARQAMPAGGKLSVRIANLGPGEEPAPGSKGLASRQRILVEVADTGTGMDEETLSHAFEPFFTTKGDKGSGLGLSISYGIVDRFGGDITVRSEPGAGTTFRIHLPRCVDESPEAGKQEAKPGGRSGIVTMTGSGRTVLLAENEDFLLSVIRRYLTAKGFRVLAARSGREALDLSRTEGVHVDLLITDVIMPEMGGKALAAALGERFPGVKVLYMSGFGEDALEGADRSDPGVEFLEKPFELDALLASVKRLFGA